MLLWIYCELLNAGLKKVFFQRRKKCFMSKEKTVVKTYENYSPVSGEIHSLQKAWQTNNKKHIRTWGTTPFSWKLLPSEYCTTPTQRKSNLAVRIASLQESWYQSDVTYFWNVTAAPNYRLFSTNKISTSRWWKTKHLTARLSFNRS